MSASRRYFIPETVQTSAMDCGPASLKSLLEGFGIRAHYGRLREACQTDVDGTSIDTMEEVANRLGLHAEQVMLPVDMVLLPEARVLPALAVTVLPSGMTHFAVLWRRVGPFIQMMDPGTGRRWLTAEQLHRELYVHQLKVPAEAWRSWLVSGHSQKLFRTRLRNLGATQEQARGLVREVLTVPGWLAVGSLDGAIRMTQALVGAGALRKGPMALRFLQETLARARSKEALEHPVIPLSYWAGVPADDDPDQVIMTGAVLVRVLGKRGEEETEGADASEAALSDAETGEAENPEDIEASDAEASRAPAGQHEGLEAAGPGQDGEEGARGGEAESGGQAARGETEGLSPELRAALEDPPVRLDRLLVQLVLAGGMAGILWLGLALLLAAAGVAVEALLYRSALELTTVLGTGTQRLGSLAAFAIFVLAMVLLELPSSQHILRLGRQVELRLRLAFLQKLPRLEDRYFRSRPTSDMAERSHSTQLLRQLPELMARGAQVSFDLLCTVAAITWLDASSLWPAVATVGVSTVLSVASTPVLAERDLRMRVHMGSLTRFYLDALLGLIPVRAHGAEKALRREHESLLAEWVQAARGMLQLSVWVDALQSLAGMGLVGLLLTLHLERTGQTASVLLLAWWALRLPGQGAQLGGIFRQYPALRNVAMRLVEPLGAPEAPDVEDVGTLSQGTLTRQQGSGLQASPSLEGRTLPFSTPSPLGPLAQPSPLPSLSSAPPSLSSAPPSLSSPPRGVSIQLDQVTVLAGGHVVLEGVSLQLPAGQQVGIVGPSGAGKSSLVGLLLGFMRPSSGTISVDGLPLGPLELQRLRQETAWVDPGAQVWRRSLLENLRYGQAGFDGEALARVLDQAELLEVLERLPDGLQTELGEGGGLVSGGEGQRVRLGRAMLRREARLVILDEPFRGLDRSRRRRLLEKARGYWPDATLLCITHDVAETLGLSRVLVVEHGKVVEDGAPLVLQAAPESRFRSLLEAEDRVRHTLWEDPSWRHLRLEDGHLIGQLVQIPEVERQMSDGQARRPLQPFARLPDAAAPRPSGPSGEEQA